MARTPESKVKAGVRKIIKSFPNLYYTTPIGTGFGASGAPDFILCVNGFFVGIECKAGKNTLTKLQERVQHDIAQAGGYYLLINEDNLHDVQILLESLISNTHK